jgi:hypothetical protein
MLSKVGIAVVCGVVGIGATKLYKVYKKRTSFQRVTTPSSKVPLESDVSETEPEVSMFILEEEEEEDIEVIRPIPEEEEDEFVRVE